MHSHLALWPAPVPNINDNWLIDALMEFQELTLALEDLITNVGGRELEQYHARTAHDDTLVWWDDDDITLRGNVVIVKDLATCPRQKVRLVIHHLPRMAIVTYTANATTPAAQGTLACFAAFAHSLDVVWVQRDGAVVHGQMNAERILVWLPPCAPPKKKV